MSAETPAYSETYIQAWTLISLLVSVIIFIAFCFGQTFLHTGHWIWDLIRYICSPII